MDPSSRIALPRSNSLDFLYGEIETQETSALWDLVPAVQIMPLAPPPAFVETVVPQTSSAEGSLDEHTAAEVVELPPLFPNIELQPPLPKRQLADISTIEEQQQVSKLFRCLLDERQPLELEMQRSKTLEAFLTQNWKLVDQLLVLTGQVVEDEKADSVKDKSIEPEVKKEAVEENSYHVDPDSYPLHHVIADKKSKLQDILRIMKGYDLSKQDTAGNTALYVAILRNRNFGIIRKLANNNSASINLANNEGDTALHCAVKMGQLDVVNLLKNLNADITAKNFAGHAPEHYAQTRSMKLALK